MPPNHSIWRPMRQPSFRGLWFCGGFYFIGNGMQSMAAAWLRVELAGSSFLAALVQTAVFLPMFLLALPAQVGLVGCWEAGAGRHRSFFWCSCAAAARRC